MLDRRQMTQSKAYNLQIENKAALMPGKLSQSLLTKKYYCEVI